MGSNAGISWQMWVVVGAVLLFYMRLIQLRGKRLRERRERERELARGKRPVQPAGPQPAYRVSSWWLIGLGAGGMLAGLAMRYTSLPVAGLADWWWLSISLGVLVFALGLK